MARAVLAVTTTSTNAAAVQTETVRSGGLTGSDGLYIPASADVDDRLFVYIRETANGATGSVWVKAGSGYDAVGQGDLEVTVGGSAAIIVGPLEKARFGQGSTGTVNIDMGGVTGVVSVISAKK